MKYVIVTGSSGLVATELIHELLKKNDHIIYAVSTHPDMVRKRWERAFGKDPAKIFFTSLDEMKECFSKIEGGSISFVHCAFARSKQGKEIADSLDYLRKVLDIVQVIGVKHFIQISSQSVYGQSEKPFWRESTPVSPDSLYSLGKYASELLVKTALQNSGINYTNVRLSSVCENARFLNVFVKKALAGESVKVIGGDQRCTFIDVRDVASALMAMIEQDEQIQYAERYNLGIGTNRSIYELAEDVKYIVEEQYGKRVVIEKEDTEITSEVGMDPRLFCETFKWNTAFGYDDMIKSLIEFQIAENPVWKDGAYPFAFDMVYRNIE